jgi:hypothetical protein
VDKYAQIYLQKLADEGGGFWKGLGGIAKTMLVDPAVGMVKDPYDAIRSGLEGDWATAGGKALSGLGNAAWTAGNAISFVPLFGGAAGIGLRGLGAGIKGLSAVKGLSGAAGVGAKVVSAGQRTSAGAAAAGKGVLNAANKIPGSQWLIGDYTSMNPFTKRNLKSIAGLGTVFGGSGILGHFGADSKFQRHMRDPNFVDWIGPQRHELLLRNAAETSKARVFGGMEESGLVSGFKDLQKELIEKQKREQRLQDLQTQLYGEG